MCWQGRRWINAHDARNTSLGRILSYIPRYVDGCCPVDNRFRIQLAVHAWRLGSSSNLWAAASSVDKLDGLEVLGKVEVLGREYVYLVSSKGAAELFVDRGK